MSARSNSAGFVRIYRSILDNRTFGNGDEAMFFAFLILKANWKQGERRYDERVYQLERGQLVIGQRKLAEEYGWSRQKVRGAMSRLEATGMLTQYWAQHGAQRAPVITICNYDIYQAPAESDEPTSGPRSAQGRPKVGPPKKEGKEGNKGKEQNDYAFAGRVIRLTRHDYDRWQVAYSHIDLRGELQALDDYYDANLSGGERKKWYPRCSQALAKRNERARSEAKAQHRDPPDSDVIY